MIIEEVVYQVSTNTDLTEGRGREYPLYYFKREEDAIKAAKGGYVMGSNCPVKKINLIIKIFESWAEFQLDKNNTLVTKALDKLSKEEIAALGLDHLQKK